MSIVRYIISDDLRPLEGSFYHDFIRSVTRGTGTGTYGLTTRPAVWYQVYADLYCLVHLSLLT
jgi:hypothetical protein